MPARLYNQIAVLDPEYFGPSDPVRYHFGVGATAVEIFNLMESGLKKIM